MKEKLIQKEELSIKNGVFDPSNIDDFVDDRVYIDNEKLDCFRNKLNDMLTDLRNKVKVIDNNLNSDKGTIDDSCDAALNEQIYSQELNEKRRALTLINKIIQALETIERDEYGYCQSCGEEIGIRRLEIRPTANLCVECKNRAESSGKK